MQKKKVHPGNWNSTCKDKEKGGFGIRCRETNFAMLVKFRFEVAMNPNDLLTNVIRSKYVQDQSIPNWLP